MEGSEDVDCVLFGGCDDFVFDVLMYGTIWKGSSGLETRCRKNKSNLSTVHINRVPM